MSKPAVSNITIEAGTTWQRTLRFYSDVARTIPLDLTGLTLTAQVRADTVTIDITCAVTDAANGVATATILPAATRDVRPQLCQWDLLATTAGGVVKKYIEGSAKIKPTQTRTA